MIFASSNLLGIAVADRTIACAELSGRGDRATVKRAAIFVLPPDLSLDKPEAVGTALGSFLEQQGFSSSRAVVGVPAKWLVAVEKDVPPATVAQLKVMLRLQAERLPLAESGELVFDYAGHPDTSKATKVLLIALLRKQLERVERMIEAAGLQAVAVTPAALAVASAVSSRLPLLGSTAAGNVPMVVLGRGGAEVVWQRQGNPRMLRHVGVTISNGHGPAMDTLGTELRRAVALTPSLGHGGAQNGGSGNDEMFLCDGIGLDDQQVAELSQRLGMKVRSDGGLEPLGVKSSPAALATRPPAVANGDVAAQFVPALALALVGTQPRLLPLNFLDSRLAPPRVRRFGKRSVWIGTIAAVLVVGIIGLYVNNSLLEGKLTALKNEHISLKGKIDEAKTLQDRVTVASGYFDKRSPMLECLREVAETFQDQDPMWTTNFKIQEDRDGKEMGRCDGVIDGKTTNPDTAVQLADRLRQNPRFTKVDGPGVTPGGSGSRNRESAYSFSIKFTYTAIAAAATVNNFGGPTTQPAAGNAR